MSSYKKTLDQVPFVQKSWGFERIFDNNDLYCGKLLRFASGRGCSLHFHKLKTESFYLHSGKVILFSYEDGEKLLQMVCSEKYPIDKVYELADKVILRQGDVFKVPIGLAHQIFAVEDSDLFEFSTTDFAEDSYRIIPGSQ